MKKNFLIIFSIVLLCFVFSGCKKKTYCEKNGHNYLNATCIEPSKCAECGDIKSDALGHKVKEGNCLIDSICTVCNEIIKKAPGHTLVVDEKVEPTCTTTGLTEGTHCSVCNEVFLNQEEIAKLEHNWVNTGTSLEKVCSLCSETQTIEDVLINEINNLISDTIDEKINLPSTIFGYDVIWESTDKDVLLNNGIIVSSDMDKKVSLIAKVIIDGVDYVIKKDLIVESVVVSTGAYDIAYNYYVTRLNKVIAKNVSLITREYNGCTVEYLSEDESIISSDGIITQTKVNQYVVMNMYVIKNGVAVLYKQEVEIASFTPGKRVQEVNKLVDLEVEKFRNGEVAVLPTYNEDYEVSISWVANIPEFVMTDTIKLTPINKTDIKLKAVLLYNDTDLEVNYELENIGGLISEEEFINELLKYMSEIELKGSINHLHDEYNNGEMYLDYQERINSYGVLNLAQPTSPKINREYLIDTTRTDIKNKLFSGVKYTPSQEDLDKFFGTGAQLPNDDNILFVTVHESAMTVVGQSAEYLAQMQYRSAFETNNPREASWHYQVDAYDIHQSFEDNIRGWHSGEKYGNNYGVGIEMCVNQDGNYEGTLANNAKLVASLMLKYNLIFDNVYRHYDHSGKECPSYLIRTNRWYEFVQMVGKEYLIQKYLLGATVKYELSTDNYETTEEVLNKYFITGDNNLYYNKKVSENVLVDFSIKVNKHGKEYSINSQFMLLPDKVSEGE